jgi:hypothetical protein
LKGARRRKKDDRGGEDSTSKTSLTASLRPYASYEDVSGEKEEIIERTINKKITEKLCKSNILNPFYNVL